MLIILLVIGCIVFAYKGWKDCDAVVGFLILFSGLLLSIQIVLLAFAALSNVEYGQQHQDIVSLNINSTVSGDFFLGSGSIDEVEYYFYYKKCADGGYLKEQIPVVETKIYETNDISPRLQWTEVRSLENKYTSFFIGASGYYFVDQEDFKFFVPEGTIIKEFSVR